jgi:hypothetical protein
VIAPFEALPAIPFQLLLLMFAGWIKRHQLDVIGVTPSPARSIA